MAFSLLRALMLSTDGNGLATVNVEFSDALYIVATIRLKNSHSARMILDRFLLTESPDRIKHRLAAYCLQERPNLRRTIAHLQSAEGGDASDKPIDSAVLSRMKQFRAMNKFKQLALKVIAENLSVEEIQGLKQMFTNIDTDASGSITYEELKDGLAHLGSKLSESEAKHLMEAADVDGDGTIYYIEFITATMHKYMFEVEENLYKAFQYFDKDNSGYITRDCFNRLG